MGELTNARSSERVSAIVPTYNRARYLGEALESILGQTHPPAQVIVVDDGSKDNTQEVLAGFRPRVQVVQKQNGGKASALNLALSLATEEFVWIFDDDDVAIPEALEKLVAALAHCPECGFAFGRHDHLVQPQEGAPKLVQPNLYLNPSLDLRLSILERCYIFQPGLLVRRACYQALGPFNEALVRSQDYEMLIRLSRQFEGIRVDDILFHQRQHSGPRGSAASPVTNGQTANAWIRYDRLIFSTIYNTYRLAEYLPKRLASEADLSPIQKFRALLERCCVMARKGMWDFAAADLRSAAVVAQTHADLKPASSDLECLRRVFGPYSYADQTMSESRVFFACLREVEPRWLRRKMTRLLFSPLLRELLYSLRKRQPRYFLGTARKCLRFCLIYVRNSQPSQRSVDSTSGIQY